MIFLQLFWTYFKIGLFTIGGGYAMLPMIQSEVVDNFGWITKGQMLDFIGIAESTPGPFAINLATFVGYSVGSGQGGFLMGLLGGAVATAGVVLPSLVIIMIVSALFNKFINSKYVQGFFFGVRPVVVGLVLASAVTVFFSVIMPGVSFDVTEIANSEWSVNIVSLLLTALITAVSFIKIKGKALHPIIFILIGAAIGVVLFGVFGLEQGTVVSGS